MSKKKEPQAPNYTVVATGLISVSESGVCHFGQGSRVGVSSLSELHAVKDGRVGTKTRELWKAILTYGYMDSIPIITTPLGFPGKDKSQAAEVKKWTKEREQDRQDIEAFCSALWGKAETYKGDYMGSPTEFGPKQVLAEFDLLWGNDASESVKDSHEPAHDGNRRLSMLPWNNAAARAAGRLDRIVTKVNRECRQYATIALRDEGSAFLNRFASIGKQDANDLQTYRQVAKLFAAGKNGGEIEKRLALKGGLRQRFVEPLTCNRMVAWFHPEEAKELKAGYLDGSITIPKQGDRLKAMTRLRLRCEHSNGKDEGFDALSVKDRKATAIKGADKVKKFLTANPSLVKDLLDLMVNLKDVEFVPAGGVVKRRSVSSDTITKVASDLQHKGLESLLNIAGGVESTISLNEQAEAIQAELAEKDAEIKRLSEPVFLRDDSDKSIPMAKREMKDRALLQKDIDGLLTKLEASSGVKASKAG